MGENLLGSLVEDVVEAEAHDEGQGHRRAEPGKIRECGVTENPGVGAENLEKDGANENIHRDDSQKSPEIALKGRPAVKGPIDDHEGKEDDQAIDCQHAPVWEGAPREIPFDPILTVPHVLE